MNYRDAVRYLDTFVNYERLGYEKRASFRLERMRRLAGLCGNPQDSFPCVHVTGTKGKGSVASFISGILVEAGYKVGLYTSPHLVSPRERIRLNNAMIDKRDYASCAARLKEITEKANLGFSPTFFEAYTALAFSYFRAKKVNFGVIEVGLGGRLDATNIISGMVSVISPVSHDHTHILGGSLASIASEKAGIIKKGAVCVSAPQKKAVSGIIGKKCRSLGVPLISVGKDIDFREISHNSEREIFDIKGRLGNYNLCESRLVGRHQAVNAACAAGAAEALMEMGIRISPENIKAGIRKTENPGRCEALATNPRVIIDGAQNAESASALADTVKRNFAYRRLILVLGISKDKDIKGVCGKLAPIADAVILTKSKVKRAAEPAFIKKFIKGKGAVLTDSVGEAFRRSRLLAGAGDLILVTGSFFVIGELKEAFFKDEKRAA